MTHAITAIYGVEPMREGEYPAIHMIGRSSTVMAGQGDARRFNVTQIQRREEPCGDQALIWYDIYNDGRVALSLQGRAIAEVHYQPEEAA